MPETPPPRTVVLVSHAHAAAARVTLATLAGLGVLLIGAAAPAHAAAASPHGPLDPLTFDYLLHFQGNILPGA